MTPGCEYVVSSMTWHQWHHTAEMDSRMGRSVRRASSNAASDHGRQPISAARFARGEKWNSEASGARSAAAIRPVKEWRCDIHQRGLYLYPEPHTTFCRLP